MYKRQELYPTNDVRFNFALFLEKNNKREKAIDEYLKILPQERALQKLIDLKVDDEIICKALVETNSLSLIHI